MKLILGDCIEKMKELPDNSVDSIVTDPPYHLVSIVKRFGKENSAPLIDNRGEGGPFSRTAKGFMGKQWDGVDERGYGIAQKPEVWKECLRVLKPGGHLLSACGTRTYHRMAVAIEDAGFEIRDIVAWIYGSGFPKSHNVALDIDKMEGLPNRGHRIAVANRHHPDGTLEPNGEILPAYEPKTENAKKWAGWGTALKPAMELWTLARKPLEEKTVAQNVLKYGTGGINVDACRVGTEEISVHNAPVGTFAGGEPNRGSDTDSYRTHLGRFPANIIHDGSEEVLEGFPQAGGGYGKRGADKNIGLLQSDKGWGTKNTGEIVGFGDSGSASRFFYCAKASKGERDKGLEGFEEKPIEIQQPHNSKDLEERDEMKSRNYHPTVKPVDLMKYLCKLITPPKGIVLDPFMGSGSTGIACKLEGFDFIGIEKEEEYLKIAEARIAKTEVQTKLF